MKSPQVPSTSFLDPLLEQCMSAEYMFAQRNVDQPKLYVLSAAGFV